MHLTIQNFKSKGDNPIIQSGIYHSEVFDSILRCAFVLSTTDFCWILRRTNTINVIWRLSSRLQVRLRALFQARAGT